MEVVNPGPAQECNAVNSTGVHDNGYVGGNAARHYSAGISYESVDGPAGCLMKRKCNEQYQTTPCTDGRVIEQD